MHYNWELQKEQAWHKVAAMLYALGASQAQIARELDRTPQAVCNLVKQERFQSRVAEIMAESLHRTVSGDRGEHAIYLCVAGLTFVGAKNWAKTPVKTPR